MRKLSIMFMAALMMFTFIKLPFVNAEGTTILENAQQVYVQITTPFKVGEDFTTSASFVDIPDEAAEFGLQSMELVGHVKTTPAEDDSVTGTIEWTSARSTGTEQLTKILKNPLTSEFTAEPNEQVDSGYKILAVGDLELLSDDLTTLDEQVQEASKDNDEVVPSTTTSGVQPSSGTTSDSGGRDSDDLKISTDKKSTTYELCEDFIDEGGMTVYGQRKTIVTGESGTVYSQSGCENYEVVATIEVKAGDCSYSWDYDAGETGEAIKMEQWYYVDPNSGEEVLVGACRDSNTTHPIENECSNTICQDYFDEANGLVFPQCAKGIHVNGTWVPSPAGCQPNDSVSYEVFSEYVTEDIENEDGTTTTQIATQDDYTNGVSYPKIRKYYNHPTKGKTYLTEAVISDTESYSHLHDTTACGWVMEDENLQGYELSNTYIKTPDPYGIKVLQECAARDGATSYAFLGLKAVETKFYASDEWQSFSPPDGIVKFKGTAVAGGEAGEWKNGHDADDSNPGVCQNGGTGGAAGQIIQNVAITTTEGETIPVYVGKGGYTTLSTTIDQAAYRFNTSVYQAYSNITTYAPENSMIGDGASSFSQIVAVTGNTPGFAPNPAASTWSQLNYKGGAGANGFYDGTTNMAAKTVDHGTDFRYHPHAGVSSNFWVGIYGLSGEGYGAGGGGAPPMYNNGKQESHHVIAKIPGADGNPGLVIISYNVLRYLRPDGTTYEVPTNEVE